MGCRLPLGCERGYAAGSFSRAVMRALSPALHVIISLNRSQRRSPMLVPGSFKLSRDTAVIFILIYLLHDEWLIIILNNFVYIIPIR